MRDEGYMLRAFALARRGMGSTSPNPAVGCVIVKDGKIVGKGFHRRAGLPHAEIEALSDAGPKAQGAELFVTLEPCNHLGRTAPCTESICAAGVKRVIYSVPDPNPAVDGKGAQRLRDSGIEVTSGVLPELGTEVIRPFALGFERKRPFITLKLALTADGKLATGDPEKRWVSSAVSRAYVQRLRSRTDAILVGNGTIKTDNPSLTNRLGRGGRPLRVILGSTEFSETLQIFDRQAETLIVPSGRDLREMLRDLYDRGTRTVLCEGGARVASSLLELRLIDRLIIMRAPIDAAPIELPQFIPDFESQFHRILARRIGPDTLTIFEPRE